MSLETRIQLLAQSIGLDIKNLSQQGYSLFPIWAEESGSLSLDNAQWSFGNGAVGNIGIPVPALEVYALSFNSEISGTSVEVDVMRNNSTLGFVNFTSGNSYQELVTPLNFTEGQLLGFKTGAIVGAFTDARICAWCRIPMVGLKGADGLQGLPGTDGIPSACMRIPLTGQSNVNGVNVTILLGAPTINTIAGGSVSSNQVNLPAGIYKVTLDITVNSSSQKPNIGFRFMKNAVLYSSRSGSNYIRATSGHDEAGDSISDLVDFVSSGTLGFQSFQEGIAGTVNLDGGQSRVLIQKLS